MVICLYYNIQLSVKDTSVIMPHWHSVPPVKRLSLMMMKTFVSGILCISNILPLIFKPLSSSYGISTYKRKVGISIFDVHFVFFFSKSNIYLGCLPPACQQFLVVYQVPCQMGGGGSPDIPTPSGHIHCLEIPTPCTYLPLRRDMVPEIPCEQNH